MNKPNFSPFDTELIFEAILERVATRVIEILDERNKKEKEEKLISTDEVCALFEPRITRMTVYNWVNKGVLNKKVIGGKVCFSLAEVIESAKNQKRFKAAS